MPRQRWIWPSIWIDEDFNALSIQARLLFIGMFSTADDHGRGNGSPSSLRAAIFPGDDTVTKADLAKWSAEISDRGMVRFYTGWEGRTVCYDIPDWNRWQKPRFPSASKVPAYQDVEGLRKASGKATVELPHERREEGWGEEKRRDQAIGLDRAPDEKNTPPRTTAPQGAAAKIDPIRRSRSKAPTPQEPSKSESMLAIGKVAERYLQAVAPTPKPEESPPAVVRDDTPRELPEDFASMTQAAK